MGFVLGTQNNDWEDNFFSHLPGALAVGLAVAGELASARLDSLLATG